MGKGIKHEVKKIFDPGVRNTDSQIVVLLTDP